MERVRSNRTALSKSKTFTSPVMICIAVSAHSGGNERGRYFDVGYIFRPCDALDVDFLCYRV